MTTLNKTVKATFYFLIITLFINCNNYGDDKAKKYIKNDKCLNELYSFAKELRIDKTKYLNYYFNDQKQLDICDFKDFRGNLEFENSIVLILLKIYNYNLKNQFNHILASPISDISKFSSKLIYEFAYLYYGKDIYFEEKLLVDNIVQLIKRHSRYLKVKEIRDEYMESYIYLPH
ncbi:MAG: hypothetical protein REI78_00375 [Pedobacter sp.]|nr:hypothetical protein [Pedobacter sp.]